MNTAQTTKTIAQKIARQMAQEPLELLKDVKEQTALIPNQENQSPQETQPPQEKVVQDQNAKIRSERLMNAYQRELDDIRRQNKFNELQRRISQGETIPLEDYPELSMEQKQVLKAQTEAVALRRQDSQTPGQLAEPAAKKGRRLFNFGKKTAMQREQTRVEKPVPPSG